MPLLTSVMPGDTFDSRNPSFMLNAEKYMSGDRGFPTMWYVRPAKPQISLRVRAV